MSSDPVTVTDVGEFGLIARIREGLSMTPNVIIGPGDDAAEVATGESVLITVDVLVEGRHFRRDWSSAVDVGRRAAAASLADIAAMGGTSTAVVVGFGAPADLPASWAQQCAAGIAEECGRAGAALVGGDVTAADQVVVSVTAIGDPPETGAVLRSGAEPGDVLALHGRVGWAAAGLAVLGRGFRAPKALVDAYRFPDIDYRQGARAAARGAHAMIDVSDGLVADARHIAEASGVAITLDPEALAVPEPIATTASAYNVDPREWMLTGGDDHAFLAAFPDKKSVPKGWTIVGVVQEGEAGVYVNGHRVTRQGGHTHFA
ncbi:MAG: thiamine-phosphate kinase [Actinomycetota bacterium]